MKRSTITRRDFLVSAGAVAGTAVLASCGTKPTATPVIQTVVKEQTKVVEKAVTTTPVPTKPPAPAVLDVWWNSDIDLKEAAAWKNDPNNDYFKAKWYWGGLAGLLFNPFVANHPGVTLKISGHSWDSDLRQNQMMALAAGLVPDTTYGEAYVNEFVQLGVYNPVGDAAVALFPEGPCRGAKVGGKVYGLPMSSGADVLFINLTTYKKAGLDPAKLPATWDELVAACQAISKINKSDKWGNSCYYTYGPSPTYGTAMRILHWFNQNGCPLADDLGKPSANVAKAADTWEFHNKLMWTSTEALILQAESESGSGQLFNDGVIVVKPGWNNDATSVGAGNIDGTAIPFPIPAGGKPASILIGNQLNSPCKNGKNPDLAVKLIEESCTREDAQAFLADQAGIWIPALKSQLSQYKTYDKLGGYKTDTAKKMVRVTMQTLLEGNTGPLPGFPKNGDRCWNEWNNSYERIWKGKMAKDAIQKELDALEKTIEGLLVKTG